MARLEAALLPFLVLAGCVDLFQEEIAGKEGATTPAVGFSDSEAADQIVVVQAPPSGVSWSDYDLMADPDAWFRLNEGAPRQAGATRGVAIGSGPVQNADKIDFCLPKDEGAEVRILYTPTNTIVHVFSFGSLRMHDYCRG